MCGKLRLPPAPRAAFPPLFGAGQGWGVSHSSRCTELPGPFSALPASSRGGLSSLPSFSLAPSRPPEQRQMGPAQARSIQRHSCLPEQRVSFSLQRAYYLPDAVPGDQPAMAA
jgi:hypothetical protein